MATFTEEPRVGKTSPAEAPDVKVDVVVVEFTSLQYSEVDRILPSCFIRVRTIIIEEPFEERWDYEYLVAAAI